MDPLPDGLFLNHRFEWSCFRSWSPKVLRGDDAPSCSLKVRGDDSLFLLSDIWDQRLQLLDGGHAGRQLLQDALPLPVLLVGAGLWRRLSSYLFFSFFCFQFQFTI